MLVGARGAIDLPMGHSEFSSRSMGYRTDPGKVCANANGRRLPGASERVPRSTVSTGSAHAKR